MQIPERLRSCKKCRVMNSSNPLTRNLKISSQKPLKINPVPIQIESRNKYMITFGLLFPKKHHGSSATESSTSDSDRNMSQEEPDTPRTNKKINPINYSIRSRVLITKEIEKCQAESIWPRYNEPMVWWANHTSEYKLLTPSVLKYLSAPPSSVTIISAAALAFTENTFSPNTHNVSFAE